MKNPKQQPGKEKLRIRLLGCELYMVNPRFRTIVILVIWLLLFAAVGLGFRYAALKIR